MKKRIISTCLTAGILTILSCGNDDDTGSTTEETTSIVGKWKIVSESVDGIATSYGPCGGDVLTVNEDNTFTAVGFFSNADDQCVVDGNESGTWSKDNNSLILDYTANIPTEDWTITDLTATTLKMTEPSIDGEEVIRTYNKE